MDKKVGVYICSGCGIGDSIDVEQLAKVATSEGSVPVCKDHPSLCLAEGAEIIFIPTAIGYLQEQDGTALGSGEREAWETVQRGHAIANGCFLAAINRVGFEPDPYADDGLMFWGASFISDPYGSIIAQASETDEENLIAEIDLNALMASPSLGGVGPVGAPLAAPPSGRASPAPTMTTIPWTWLGITTNASGSKFGNRTHSRSQIFFTNWPASFNRNPPSNISPNKHSESRTQMVTK